MNLDDAKKVRDQFTTEEKQRIEIAVSRIANNNPEVVKQLEALAELKENNPVKWKLGLKALKL
ncbi:MAG: hypothetical protein EKK37_17345 [Sphingobacteriales bacterium]|nr:MAG: hypothetical protein EKK37_17345 [Sphingobacteriales bacterium]